MNLNDEFQQIKVERNYLQNETDVMEKLFSNTLKKIEDEKQNYILKEKDFQ